jgi:hypothetical protein
MASVATVVAINSMKLDVLASGTARGFKVRETKNQNATVSASGVSAISEADAKVAGMNAGHGPTWVDVGSITSVPVPITTGATAWGTSLGPITSALTATRNPNGTWDVSGTATRTQERVAHYF